MEIRRYFCYIFSKIPLEVKIRLIFCVSEIDSKCKTIIGSGRGKREGEEKKYEKKRSRKGREEKESKYIVRSDFI